MLQPPIGGWKAFIFLSGKISFLPYADMKIPSNAPQEIEYSGFAVIKGGTVMEVISVGIPRFNSMYVTVKKRKTKLIENDVILPKTLVIFADLASISTGSKSRRSDIAIPAAQP